MASFTTRLGWLFAQCLALLPVVAMYCLLQLGIAHLLMWAFFPEMPPNHQYLLLMSLGFGLTYALMASRRSYEPWPELEVSEPSCGIGFTSSLDTQSRALKLKKDIARVGQRLGVKPVALVVMPCCGVNPAYVSGKNGGWIVLSEYDVTQMLYEHLLSVAVHELAHAADSAETARRFYTRQLVGQAVLWVLKPMIAITDVMGIRVDSSRVSFWTEIVFQTIFLPTRLMIAWLGRQAEYRADAISAQYTSVDSAIGALNAIRKKDGCVQLFQCNMAGLTLVMRGRRIVTAQETGSLLDDHPMIDQRIAALKALRG